MTITTATAVTEMTDDIAEAILTEVAPQIGGFDVESGDAWKTLRGEIADWLAEGDYNGETVEALAVEVRAEFGGQIERIGNR